MREPQAFFQLELFHSYYDNGRFQEYQLTPNPETFRILQKHKIRIDQKEGQLRLFSDQGSTFLDYMRQTYDDSPLLFNFSTQNAYFYNITDLPFSKSVLFNYSTERAEKDPMAPSGSLLTVDFSKQFSNSKIGSLSINWADISTDKPAEPFRIRFEARKTHWRFYIINRSTKKMIAPKIVSESDIVFQDPVPTRINNEESLMFSSGDTTIPFSQQPKHRFDLVDAQADNASLPRTLISNLPLANVKSFVLDDQQKSYSDIYVYL